MTIERNTQHGYGQYERERHTRLALFIVAFVYTPDKAGRQQDDIYDDAAVERHAERIDEEQLEPAAHFYNTRNDTVQYGRYQYHGCEKRQQRAFCVGIGHFLIVVYQHDGRETEQVQQVNADTQSGEVGDKNQPAVGMRLVRYIFPLQYQPEHHRRKQ